MPDQNKWPDHVRLYYAEWLREAGLRPESDKAFDRFVSLMEERMGDFLMDQCADHSRLGLVPEDLEITGVRHA